MSKPSIWPIRVGNASKEWGGVTAERGEGGVGRGNAKTFLGLGTGNRSTGRKRQQEKEKEKRKKGTKGEGEGKERKKGGIQISIYLRSSLSRFHLLEEDNKIHNH